MSAGHNTASTGRGAGAEHSGKTNGRQKAAAKQSAPADSLVFVEDSDPHDRFVFKLTRLLYKGRTDYQSVLIADTVNFKRVLVLDGAIQSAEVDEKVYHETLVQPAMLAHRSPKRVLIIGGGEGATLREVLAHPSVDRAIMVDLDEKVVELCREHLGSWHQGSFDDPRARLVIADGREFVEGDDGGYDVVIVDVVDMLDNGPAQKLYTRQFYELLRMRLRPGGIVVVQGLEFSFLDAAPHAALARTLRAVFPEVHSYSVPIPSFLSSWAFLIASDHARPADWTADMIDRRIAEALPRGLRHLDGEYLLSRFAHCRQTRRILAQPGPILEDGVKFVMPADEE